MAFWRRIYCHFCGVRSPYYKSSGIQEFQCQACEARNYVDAAGNIVDTPWTVAAAPSKIVGDTKHKAFDTFTRGTNDPARGHQKQQVFCNTCLHNQRVYNETLANYLPDDDHPRYAEFEASLPQFTEDLEKRYPQICKACAPMAQLKVNRADYYSMTDNLAKAHLKANPRRRGGLNQTSSRDDWFKLTMRVMLRLLGLGVWLSTAVQCWWHAYGIYHALFGKTDSEIESDSHVFESTLGTCATAAYHFRTDDSCYKVFGSYVPRTLLLALCLVWYNHGIKAYYDPITRYGSVTGQKQHLSIQLIVLAVRAATYFNMSDPTITSQMTRSKVIAVHGFAIGLILGGRWFGRRTIQAHKWRLDRKMMPKPEEADVLGKNAGPAREKHVAQASSKLPFSIFAKQPKEPLRIDSLAPQRSVYGSHVWNGSSGGPPPSPQGSDSTVEDLMEIDMQPPSHSRMPGAPEPSSYNAYGGTSSLQIRPNTRSTTNRFTSPQSQGWEDVRSNLFGIEDDMRAQNERRRPEAQQNAGKLSYNPQTSKSPFYGRLPAAPKSLESRLRNPVSQVPRFKEPPLTQQKNFLDQMRSGIEKGRTFGSAGPQTPAKINRHRNAQAFSIKDPDPDFSPAASRTRGNLDLRPSDWHLPSDTANQATGLEDLFGGRSFRISEEPELPPVRWKTDQAVDWNTVIGIAGVAVMVASVAVLCVLLDARRWFFLGLVQLLERVGAVPSS